MVLYIIFRPSCKVEVKNYFKFPVLNFHFLKTGAALNPQPVRARTIFQRALEASKLTWGDKHLQLILRHDLDIDEADKDTDMFDGHGIPLWHGKDKL